MSAKLTISSLSSEKADVLYLLNTSRIIAASKRFNLLLAYVFRSTALSSSNTLYIPLRESDLVIRYNPVHR